MVSLIVTLSKKVSENRRLLEDQRASSDPAGGGESASFRGPRQGGREVRPQKSEGFRELSGVLPDSRFGKQRLWERFIMRHGLYVRAIRKVKVFVSFLVFQRIIYWKVEGFKKNSY